MEQILFPDALRENSASTVPEDGADTPAACDTLNAVDDPPEIEPAPPQPPVHPA